MPAIAAQTIKSPIPAQLNFVTLDGTTDKFTVNTAILQSLILTNTTASPVAITIIGDEAAATYKCKGYQTAQVEPLEVVVAANATSTVYVSTFANTLAGESTITGGVGLTAALINLT